MIKMSRRKHWTNKCTECTTLKTLICNLGLWWTIYHLQLGAASSQHLRGHPGSFQWDQLSSHTSKTQMSSRAAGLKMLVSEKQVERQLSADISVSSPRSYLTPITTVSALYQNIKHGYSCSPASEIPKHLVGVQSFVLMRCHNSRFNSSVKK